MNRYPIPALGPHAFRRGPAAIAHRSFPSGPRDFLRRYRDDTLELEITLAATAGAAAQVTLHTDVGAATPGDWRDAPFETADGVTFRLALPLPRCGLYRFRVKYTLDGSQWLWDHAPHSYVLVDPPSLRTVRLYTLIPSASGTVRDWTQLLPAIAGMGFDALHLLPVTAMGASQSPYSASDLFRFEDRFRDPADTRDGLTQFEDFVAECRRQGLRLCLDLVLNHVGADSLVANRRPDWIVPDENESDGFRRAGCWHLHNWIRWEDLVLVHYDHPSRTTRHDIWDYMKQYALFWSNYAAQTGGMVRFDNLHSSHGPFVADLAGALREAFPDLAILGEYFTDQVTLERTVPEWGINLLVANSWEHPYAAQLRDYLLYLHNVSGRLRHLCALTTHDTAVPAVLFGSERAAIPRYAAHALFGLGQAAVVQGTESGVQERIPFIGPPARLAFADRPDLRRPITRLNELLATHAVFRRGGNLTFVDEGHGAVLAAYRRAAPGDGSSFLLFANLDVHNEYRLAVNLARYGIAVPLSLADQLSGENWRVHDPIVHVPLAPCGVRAFRLDA